MPTTKRRARILISSGRRLPLVEPAEVKSISTGFFLVEIALVGAVDRSDGDLSADLRPPS